MPPQGRRDGREERTSSDMIMKLSGDLGLLGQVRSKNPVVVVNEHILFIIMRLNTAYLTKTHQVIQFQCEGNFHV